MNELIINPGYRQSLSQSVHFPCVFKDRPEATWRGQESTGGSQLYGNGVNQAAPTPLAKGDSIPLTFPGVRICSQTIIDSI